MRVGFQAWGSEGDLRPLVALAARLRELGHDAELLFTVVDGKDYRPLCERLGVGLRLVPDDLSVTLEQIAVAGGSPAKILERVVERTFRPYVDAIHEAALGLCARCDVVVGGSSSFPLKAAALATNTRFATVDFLPVVPSKITPPTGLADWGPLNGARWWVLHRVLDSAFLAEPAAFFVRHGLPRPKHTVPDVAHSGLLDLHAASPSICPPAPDWGASHVVCGELLFDDGAEPWTPSPELAEFLDAGAPPVLFSLGSMEHMAPERARDLLVASARSAGVRSIVQSKRAAAEGREGDCYFVPWVPHRPLLARCGAVVHHGGAGTTHAVARAGLPSIVLPFIAEQKLWGQRLEQLGAARPPRSFWRAKPEPVAKDVRRALADDRLREASAALGARMASEERGVDVAARRLLALG